jgi:hypothetical protein
MTKKLKLSTALVAALTPELAIEIAEALPPRLMTALSTALSPGPSPDMTVDEVMAFRRESRSTVERKMRAGVYQSYLSGLDKRLITRASVEADRQRCLDLGARFDQGGKRGRPRKALESAAAAEGGLSDDRGAEARLDAEKPTDGPPQPT